MDTQTTIKKETSLSGIGLHTGNASTIAFRPAPANVGIRFFRTDLVGTPMIPARLNFVVTTVRGTNLGLNEAKVHTVEHVLSALTGLGVDNIDILVSANEPPIMDGSSMPYVKALLEAGIQALDAPKRVLHFDREVRYEDGKARYRAVPAQGFEVQATLLHDHPMLPKSSITVRIDRDSYIAELARSRTFCFEHEVAYLRSQGLAQGGSLDNAIVIAKDKFMTNAEGLRFPDEFVRHKVMDLVGDLSLTGRPLFNMRIETQCLGHSHNIEFAKRLCEAAKTMRKPRGRVPAVEV
ncbi:MAG: UDP-3-O-[3-hydroxymyristoyl] N-acetylglucosamine deacetylase [Elusimicrobia bacterium]|nr:UDP-3-O-[3-hydroxymyristoyl] N-acetylglucosamine deacetylase [Elusimicrobiota bacterium]